ASRKLRAALDAGDDLFTRKPERRLRTRVRRLARALGAVRDGDVMIATLHDLPGDGQDRPGVQRLIDRLDRQRDADRKHLLGVLDELDAGDFREASLAIFDDTDDAPHKIRRRDARTLVQGPRDRFLAMSGKLPEENDVEGL